MKSSQSLVFILAANAIAGLCAVGLLYFASAENSENIPFAGACGAAVILLVFALSYFIGLKPFLSRFQDSIKNVKQHGANFLTSTNTADDFGVIDELIQNSVKQLNETRNREKSIIENAVDVICVLDVTCAILQVNSASISVWGYRPEELKGRKVTEFLYAEDADSTLNTVLGAEQSIKKLFFENRFKHKNGELIDMLWSAHWSASDGGLFCVAHDITERKRAEQLLQESEERVRTMLENLPAGVALMDKSGNIEFMNRTAFHLTGFDKTLDLAELRASHLFSFCTEPLDLNSYLSQGSTVDCFVKHKNGSTAPAEASVSRMQRGDEPVYLVIFLDQSAKFEMAKAKRELVAMVSHELKTPLTSINLILSALLDGQTQELNARTLKWLSRGKQETTRLIQLISDLLDIEKMEAGKFSMHFGPAKIDDIIKSSIQVVERLSDLQRVEISVEGAKDCECICDGARLIQVLANLMDNALKYSPAGSKMTVAVADDADGLSVSVCNQGRGIPKDKLSTIFERFEQVSETDATEKKGTGLGLAICKTIVEQHNGKIWASSDSSGTRFTFTLPKSAETKEDLEAKEELLS